jgi:hypothetical protein
MTANERPDLPPTSFLSSLDMDPSNAQITARPSISLSDSGVNTPRASTPGTDPPRGSERREVLQDLRRLMTFAVRKDRETKNQD